MVVLVKRKKKWNLRVIIIALRLMLLPFTTSVMMIPYYGLMGGQKFIPIISWNFK